MEERGELGFSFDPIFYYPPPGPVRSLCTAGPFDARSIAGRNNAGLFDHDAGAVPWRAGAMDDAFRYRVALMTAEDDRVAPLDVEMEFTVVSVWLNHGTVTAAASASTSIGVREPNLSSMSVT